MTGVDMTSDGGPSAGSPRTRFTATGWVATASVSSMSISTRRAGGQKGLNPSSTRSTAAVGSSIGGKAGVSIGLTVHSDPPGPCVTSLPRAILAHMIRMVALGFLGLAACTAGAPVPADPRPPTVAPTTTPCPTTAPAPPAAPTAASTPSAEPALSPLRLASGAELPAGNWKEIALRTVVIHYVEEQAAEAERFRKYFVDVHAALAREFAGHDLDALMRDPVVCHAYLMPVPTRYAGPGQVTSLTSYGNPPYCELHLIAASALPDAKRCCTVVGERRDEASDHRGVAHEYGGVVLGRLNRHNAGWRFERAPGWFLQGYEEYIALTLSNDHSRTVTFEKYKDLLRADPGRVSWFSVTNDYTDGAVLIHFIHEDFGASKLKAVLLSKEKTFSLAMAKELGVGPEQLTARWTAWRKKNLPPK